MNRARKVTIFAGTLVLAASVAAPASAAISKAGASDIRTSDSTTSLVAVADSNSSARLTQVKQKCDTAVQNRVTELGTLTTQINASKTVSSTHKSALLAEVSSDKTGLTTLDATIQADTTVTQAVADCKNIVANFRIYVLEVPKVHEVLAIDGVAQVGSVLGASGPKLQTAITAAQNNGVNVGQAQTALNDLESRATSINNSVATLPGPVLALQPSGFPGNRSTLQSTRQTLGSLVTSAKAARADLKTISSVLKTSKGTTTTTAAPTTTSTTA